MGFKMYPEPSYLLPYHLHGSHSVPTKSSLTWIILVVFLPVSLFLYLSIVHVIPHGSLFLKFKLDNVTFLLKTLMTPYNSRPFALRSTSSDSCKPHSLHIWLQLLWFFSLSPGCQPPSEWLALIVPLHFSSNILSLGDPSQNTIKKNSTS